MKWLQSLTTNLKKKRSQAEAAAFPSPDDDECGELVVPLASVGANGASVGGSDADLASKPKRRSVSVDLYGSHADLSFPVGSDPRASVDLRASVDMTAIIHRRGSVDRRGSVERRASLEQWHEARRQRNSMDVHGTISTDKLTICKAAGTTIVNKTYVTIKHLGSGTFGRVMLCFNVYDQRLYAVKFCRKSQFVQTLSRYGSSGRLRRAGGGGVLASPGGSFSGPSGGGPPRSCGGGGVVGIGSANGPLPPLCPMGAAVASAAGGPHSARVALASGGASEQQQQAQQQQQQQQQQPAVVGGMGRMAQGMGSLSNPSLGTWDSGVPVLASSWARQHQSQQQQLQAVFGGTLGLSSAGRGGSAFGCCAPPPPPPPPPPALEDSAMLPLHRDASATSSAGGAGAPWPPAGALDSCGSQGASGRGGGALLSSAGMSTGVGGGGMPWGGGGSYGGSVFQEALARFQTEEVVKEIAILKKLRHPNIVNLVEVIDDPTTDSLLLVMEYVEGGTLQPRELGPARWQPVPESTAWKYVRQVLEGLDYLHSNRVVHGDLKPANLLLDSNSRRIKIADFGSSITAGAGDRARGCAGFSTPAFRSPESLASGYQPSFEMDMWALGVCVYMWVFGELPFTGAAPFIIYDKIRSQEVSLPVPRRSEDRPALSHELLDFVGRLLQKDATRRLDIASAMSHPWVTRSGEAPMPPPCGAAGDGASPAAVRPSQEEIGSAVRLSDSPVRERVEAVFQERAYEDGEALVAPGDEADEVFLIAAGEVEIVAPPALGGAGAHGPLISGFDPEGASSGADDDEMARAGGGGGGGSAGGDRAPLGGGGAGAAAGATAGAAADEDVRASMALLGELIASGGSRRRDRDGPDSWDSERHTLAVKGPGDSLGLPSLLQSQGKDHKWRAFCRARGEVTVFVARAADLQQLVARHPEMEPAVQQIATQQETDMAVAEAMRRLRIFSSCGGAAAGPNARKLPVVCATSS